MTKHGEKNMWLKIRILYLFITKFYKSYEVKPVQM